jgi:flagellar basal body-associated protein FliL
MYMLVIIAIVLVLLMLAGLLIYKLFVDDSRDGYVGKHRRH